MNNLHFLQLGICLQHGKMGRQYCCAQCKSQHITTANRLTCKAWMHCSCSSCCCWAAASLCWCSRSRALDLAPDSRRFSSAISCSCRRTGKSECHVIAEHGDPRSWLAAVHKGPVSHKLDWYNRPVVITIDCATQRGIMQVLKHAALSVYPAQFVCICWHTLVRMMSRDAVSPALVC